MASENAAPQPSIKTPNVSEKAMEDTQTPASPTPSEDVLPTMSGGLLDLMMGAFLPCVPVVVVTSLLLTLILKNQVQIDPGWPMLQTPMDANWSDPAVLNNTLRAQVMRGGGSAYWVRYNPSTLAAIASWSSRIIPFLTGTSMAVIAFFAGRRMINATRRRNTSQLPTPHQTSILIKLLSGSGAKPLWDVIVYKWQGHEKLVQPIPLAFGALLSIIVMT